MSETSYDEEKARHYAAYRPPLHQRILQNTLGKRRFHHALDVGCGMGHSSVALQNRCDCVTGTDPGEAMIAQALHAPDTDYTVFDGTHLPFPDQSFDLITLAGSWYYARSRTLYDELLRTACTGAMILVYDFSLDLSAVRELFQCNMIKSAYRHDLALDEYITGGQLTKSGRETGSGVLAVSPEDITHLILAEDGWQSCLNGMSFDSISHKIRSRLNGNYSYTTWSSLYTKNG